MCRFVQKNVQAWKKVSFLWIFVQRATYYVFRWWSFCQAVLEPGYDADFVLVDLDTPYTVDKEKLHSKSYNCPFDGAQLYGRVYATIKGGKLTYQAEE